MGLFSLAFRRSAGSLWLAAALSLLFSLVFLLVYAAGDVLEGVYADAVMSQNTYTFTLKTRDISKFSDTSMLAYTVEEGRDYNVGLSANGRSALLTRQSRGALAFTEFLQSALLALASAVFALPAALVAARGGAALLGALGYGTFSVAFTASAVPVALGVQLLSALLSALALRLRFAREKA